MEFPDKTLTCRDCGAEYIFSSGEQAFYAEKGFENEPARCPECRTSRKRDRGPGSGGGGGGGGFSRGPRQLYDVVCASCGAPTQVPFQPRQERPVYCRACFDKMNAGVR